MQTSDAICNFSSTKLSESDISLLNKGLNFSHAMKESSR